MSEDKKKVPKLRFPGFEGEWEETRLGDAVERITRKNINNETGLPLTISAKYGLIDQESFFNNRVASKDVSDYYVIKKGEFAYNKSYSEGYPYGVVKRLDRYDKGVLSTLYIIFRLKSNKICSDYVAIYYDTTKWYIEVAKRAAEGARNHGLLNISADDFFDTKLAYPVNQIEQNKIGIFFKYLERLIYYQKSKIDQIRRMQEGLLQKMLPADGESTPKVRFPGFADMWKCRKLRDIAEIIGGGTPNTKKAEYWGGDIDWYSPTEIKGKRYVDGSVKKITRKGLEKSSAKLLPGGRTILFASRASVGDMAILCHSGATNQGFQSLVLRDGYDPYFVYASGIKIKRFAVRNAAGSTFPEISAKQLGNMDYQVPTYEEQQSIGGLIRKIDDLITVHQNKLSHLEKLKKGLLQQMFI